MNALEVRKLTKTFPGTVALNEVDFQLRKGEVHAVVGENGAGKSTLMKILCGVYRKTSGATLFDGREVEIQNPAHAMNLGVSIIYQELENIPQLTIAENVFLGRLPRRERAAGFLDRKRLYHETSQLLSRLDLSFNAKTKVESLTIAQQQLVEIAKSISRNIRVLIMDEPTSYLNQKEIEKLFQIIGELKRQGISIIYVSHRLKEVLTIADRITVLRDGKVITTLDCCNNEFDEAEVIKLIVGHEVKKQLKSPIQRMEVVLDIRQLAIQNRIPAFQAKLYRGEILGIAGLTGSGKEELLQGIVGLWPAKRSIEVESRPAALKTPYDGVMQGIVYLAEERKTQSIFPELSCRENITPIWLFKSFKRLFLSRRRETAIASELIQKLSIKTPNSDQKIFNLSGGNQQKVIFGRLLAVNPKILLLNDPTRGIDVGSKSEIYEIIKGLAAQGTSIILLSSETQEICDLANRVIVLSKGRIKGEFVDAQVTMENVFTCMTVE